MQLSPRQVHLDFHTSEALPSVAENFDAKAFAKTVADAHISSMTVFARCHHGMLYYDSKKFPERVHPALKNRNLLVEQVEALHERGARAPVYITVQWDYFSATRHPEWLIRGLNGEHQGGPFTEAGFYQSLCVNTGYADFLFEQTGEVIELLGDKLDGLFFDITGIRPCLCHECRRRMKAENIDMTDSRAVRAFAKKSIDAFKARMTEFVHAKNPDCTIFYNAGHVGPCTEDSSDAYTHFELESLPSGSWGYLHFPVAARFARTLGKDCLGMTGKFHTEWGDFHSLKNDAALEFECFRMLSFGFASSVGDQLEPCGTLNPATYRLIGRVYGEFERREQWARPSTPLTDACVVTDEDPITEFAIPESIFGAAQMLEELSLQFDIVAENADFGRYRLVIIPDGVKMSEKAQKRLSEYVSKGGAVLTTGDGGLNEYGEIPHCTGVRRTGLRDVYPDFLLPTGALAEGLEPGNEYVIYEQGQELVPETADVLADAFAPYFKRDGNHFCSHRYTPSAHGKFGAHYPAAFRKGRCICFSHPLFGQYRKNAPRWCKLLVRNAIDMLIPGRLVTHDGPSTFVVSLLEQPEKSRACLHVLSYVPVRKSATIDLIEERTKVRGVTFKLHLPEKPVSARLVPDDVPLELTDDGCVTIPEIDGYAIVELSYK